MLCRFAGDAFLLRHKLAEQSLNELIGLLPQVALLELPLEKLPDVRLAFTIAGQQRAHGETNVSQHGLFAIMIAQPDFQLGQLFFVRHVPICRFCAHLRQNSLIEAT